MFNTQPITIKINPILILASAILLFIGSGCIKDQEGVIGEWNWYQSRGGFVGTITPESANYTQKLIIDKTHFRMYHNGNLLSNRPYKLERPDQPYNSDDYLLVFSNPSEVSPIRLERFHLVINEYSLDGMTHWYVRR